MIQAAMTALSNTHVRNTARNLALGLGIVTVAGFGYWIISKKLKENRLKRNYQEVEKELGVNTPDGKAAGYAAVLFSAMDGWGTNEDLIYSTIREMKSQGVLFAAVANAYRKLYGKNLLRDIQDELSSTEYMKFQKII
jgi:hypothetical protein